MRDGNVLLIANPAAQRGNGAKYAEIARDLARDMGGDLAVAPRPEGGCAFTLVLPLEERLEEEKRT